eukprot:364464-Chlamydomonas_euryale.AAC.15
MVAVRRSTPLSTRLCQSLSLPRDIPRSPPLPSLSFCPSLLLLTLRAATWCTAVRRGRRLEDCVGHGSVWRADGSVPGDRAGGGGALRGVGGAVPLQVRAVPTEGGQGVAVPAARQLVRATLHVPRALRLPGRE